MKENYMPSVEALEEVRDKLNSSIVKINPIESLDDLDNLRGKNILINGVSIKDFDLDVVLPEKNDYGYLIAEHKGKKIPINFWCDSIPREIYLGFPSQRFYILGRVPLFKLIKYNSDFEYIFDNYCKSIEYPGELVKPEVNFINVLKWGFAYETSSKKIKPNKSSEGTGGDLMLFQEFGKGGELSLMEEDL